MYADRIDTGAWRIGSSKVGQEAARLAAGRLLHQLAVHHHQGLGNRPLEARPLVPLVVGEGEDELVEPLVALRGRRRVAAGLVGRGRRQQRVEELLGRHRLQRHVAEKRLVLLVRPWSSRSKAVRLAGHDPADQRLDVVAALLKLLRQPVEQLGIARRVVRPEVVDRVDDPSAHEVAPHPVDERLGEVDVLRVGDDLAKLDPAIDVGPLADLAAVEELRERDPDQAVALVELAIRLGRLVGKLGVVVNLGRRWRRPSSRLRRLRPLKNALIPQKSACFQSFEGWS